MVNSIKRIEFFFTIPINNKRPIIENMFNDCPVIHNAKNAPLKLNGNAKRMTTGSIKELN
ncbi:hypothetical protein D3C87_1285910 [compost metagenome]